VPRNAGVAEHRAHHIGVGTLIHLGRGCRKAPHSSCLPSLAHEAARASQNGRACGDPLHTAGMADGQDLAKPMFEVADALTDSRGRDRSVSGAICCGLEGRARTAAPSSCPDDPTSIGVSLHA
ncbi:hypothetical protein WDZ92_49745, partial [Nostoc sp. NIES-2111]